MRTALPRTVVLSLALVLSLMRGVAAADGYLDLPRAPQLFYQHGVPHTDRNGRLLPQPGATSFFPRCVYESLQNMLADLKRAGFNCFKPWNGLNLESVLAEAQQTGMQLIKQFGIAPCNFLTNPACNPESNAAAQIATQTQLIAAHADHPSVLAWYIDEEPTACVNPPSNCRERLANFTKFAAAIKAADHVHPSFSIDISMPYPAALSDWEKLNAAGDIASNDSYPFVNGTENTLEPAAANFVRLVQLNQQRKPVWITLQAFEQPSPHPPHWKMPRPLQLRAEVFNAIIHGATGIIYFALDDWASRAAQVIGIAPSPQVSYPGANPGDLRATSEQITASLTLWNATVSLNAELTRLQAVLLSPTATLPYRVSIRQRGITATPIRSMLKQSPRGLYTLLVVNIDDLPLEAQFTFPTLPVELHSLQADGSARAMDASGNGFRDQIEGFGVRVYEFR